MLASLFLRPLGNAVQRSASAADPVRGTCPSGYTVKGNVNTNGERIYHVPGGAFYDRTSPERCFTSTAAAEAAGFRRSAR